MKVIGDFPTVLGIHFVLYMLLWCNCIAAALLVLLLERWVAATFFFLVPVIPLPITRVLIILSKLICTSFSSDLFLLRRRQLLPSKGIIMLVIANLLFSRRWHLYSGLALQSLFLTRWGFNRVTDENIWIAQWLGVPLSPHCPMFDPYSCSLCVQVVFSPACARCLPHQKEEVV